MSLEIRAVQTDSDQAPMVGQSIYAVLGEAGHVVTLLHLATLTEFSLPAFKFNEQVGVMYWPENRSGLTFIPEKIGRMMRNRFKDLAKRKVAFPVSKSLFVIAALEGKDLGVVLSELGSLASDGEQSEKQLKFSRRYRLAPGTVAAEHHGREKAILEVLVSLSEASFYEVVEKVQHVPSTNKKDPAKEKERMVTFFLNKFCDRGLVETQAGPGQEWSKIQVSEENEMATEKKAAKKKKVAKVGREGWLYRLAAAVKVDKIKGQAKLVAAAVEKLGKATAEDIIAEAKGQGLKAKAGAEACVKYHLHRLNVDKVVIIEKPAAAAEDAAA